MKDFYIIELSGTGIKIMTITSRNNIALGIIILLSFIVLFLLIAPFSLTRGSTASGFRDFLTPNYLYSVLLIIYAMAVMIYVRTFFYKTNSHEIFFFMLFLLTIMFESSRSLIVILKYLDSPSSYIMFLSRTAYSMEDGTGAFYKGLFEISDTAKKAGIDPLQKGRCLYININGDPVRDLEFRDFKTGKTYKINLHQNVSGSPAAPESSFGIKILAESSSSPVKAYTAGTPSVKRKNVSGYSIRKIFLSPDERNMVLVIAKTITEKDSVSVRYMVETLAL